MEKQWYKTWWGILIILCFFPLFIWGFLTKFIWNQKWSSKTRIISICLLWGIPIVFGQVFGNASQSVANTKVNTTAEYICIGPDGKKIKLNPTDCKKFNDAWKNPDGSPKTIPTDVQQVTTAPSNTPKPAEHYNVIVTSQIVKKVDGKYRYFFDVRNHDIKPFDGRVSILLFNNEFQSGLAGDSFNTTRAIEPELGTSVNLDANTGPTRIHGANGITKFKFKVYKGDTIVNTGEGLISDEYEDTDAYLGQ